MSQILCLMGDVLKHDVCTQAWIAALAEKLDIALRIPEEALVNAEH